MKPIGDEKIVYQGKIVEVVQQDFQVGAEKKVFEWARRAPGTRLIIVSPDQQILITKEFRAEVGGYDYRLPGGKVFDSLLEYKAFLVTKKEILPMAEAAAKKEAREEAGIEGENMQHIATSKCGATVEWDLYYFVVDKYKELAGQHLEAGEDISLQWLTFAEARELCMSGKMQEDRSVAVLLRWLK